MKEFYRGAKSINNFHAAHAFTEYLRTSHKLNQPISKIFRDDVSVLRYYDCI